MRLPIVSRAVGFSRDVCWLYGIDERRRQLERVDAEGLLDDLPDLRRQRAGERLRRARRQDVGLRLVRVLQRAQLGRDVLRRRCGARR